MSFGWKQVEERGRAWRRTAAAVFVLALAGCGGGDETAVPFTGAPIEAADPGPVHVHGLGYDTERRILYLATHSGMFELRDGADQATRIGTSYQDTMGFTLVAPDLFLGSGHPDARDRLPPHLGLITSTDRGRTWTPVSLLGEADFHILRASGTAVYGFDATNERLLASADGGTSWQERTRPEPLFDLAIDPADSQRLLAAGSAVLHASEDGGRTWRIASGSLTGLLAWPAPSRLFLATPGGEVLGAERPDGPWRSLGAVDGDVAALLAVDERLLFAALHDGTIVESRDGAATWQVRSRPA